MPQPTASSVSSTSPVPFSLPLPLPWQQAPHDAPANIRVPSADDLISEENEDVQKALKRLPPRQSYDRVFRLRRAVQLSVQQKILPRAEWTKPEEDKPYLGPLLSVLEAEAREREALDTVTVLKSH